MTGKSRKSQEEEQLKEPGREEGPWRRLQAFSEERFARIRPKHEEEEKTKDEAEAELPVAPGARREPEPAPDFYHDRMREYRQRQRREMKERGVEVAPSSEESVEGESEDDEDSEEGSANSPALAGAPATPMPPEAPPANNWIPIGPSVVRQGQVSNQTATSGRVAGLAVAPAATRVYAASANGGVWRSDDQGGTWRSTMDAWDRDPTTTATDSLACGAIGSAQFAERNTGLATLTLEHLAHHPSEDAVVFCGSQDNGTLRARSNWRLWDTEPFSWRRSIGLPGWIWGNSKASWTLLRAVILLPRHFVSARANRRPFPLRRSRRREAR